MSALMIREDRPPGELRGLAKVESDPRVARRLLAIAAAREGMSRQAAARIAGMDRQTLRGWVIRYNRGGPSDHWPTSIEPDRSFLSTLGMRPQWNISGRRSAEMARLLAGGADAAARSLLRRRVRRQAEADQGLRPGHVADLGPVQQSGQ
ncbi:helix-turn-helix domain-containing protein [Neoroseomonas lacus]|uniref:helix-turn-helix domain-containing protein n=1 Tax=Neoroseomonas lacus TaxID=287609 RepID=UPI00166CD6DD